MTTITLEPRAGYAYPATRRIHHATGRHPALRLTRRGRVLVLVSALLVAFVIGAFVAAAGSVATETPGTPDPTRIVQVHQGDTLWDIASGLGRGGDVRATMATIERLNAMSDSQIRVGQRLVVPAS